MSPVVYEPIVYGPCKGHYAVTRRGERMLSGRRADGSLWRRRPYYGHVWREGSTWRANVPGGRRFPGGWATRDGAGVALLSNGVSA